MNSFPSWVHRIPHMIEMLALLDTERIDRELVERIFDLRRTAAKQLLRRMGAEFCGHALGISRGLLIARLREAQEHPEWRWELERQRTVRERLAALRTPSPQRKSLVAVDATLQRQMEQVEIAGLPDTIQLSPGRLTICCRDMEDLLRQLVLLAKATDCHYELLRQQVEDSVRRPIRSEGLPADLPKEKRR